MLPKTSVYETQGTSAVQPAPAPMHVVSAPVTGPAASVAEPAKAAAPETAKAPEAVKAPETAAPAAAPAAAPTPAAEIGDEAILLFKTPTCPNCKAAGALLDKAGVQYTALNANEERELVAKFGIKQAPTLVLVHGDEFEKFRGVSDIKGWLMHKAD